MKDDMIFNLIELLENDDEQAVVSKAIELIREDEHLMEKLIYEAAISALGEAQQLKPLVDAYKLFSQQSPLN